MSPESLGVAPEQYAPLVMSQNKQPLHPNKTKIKKKSAILLLCLIFLYFLVGNNLNGRLWSLVDNQVRWCDERHMKRDHQEGHADKES